MIGKPHRFTWRRSRPRMAWGRNRWYRALHPFDERFGVDTGELLYDLPGGGNSRTSNNGYCAIPPSVFHQLMDRMCLDCSRFTFIDLGSGKGRALLLARGYGFKKVIGIEISPRLNRIACQNAERFAATSFGSPVSVMRADAADFHFPCGPLLVYMWNAFTEPVLDRVLGHLWESYESDPREIYVLYIDPDLEARLRMMPWIERLWTGAFQLSTEDYEAWAFPDWTELCSAFRLIRPQGPTMKI